GKSAVLRAAARQAEKRRESGPDEEGQSARGKHRFWLTTGARLIAGMRYLGQWEARAEQVISELAEIKGTLFVESLWELTTSGGEAGSSVAAFFAPYIARGEMRLVAEATPAELDACRRALPSLVGLFQIVTVPAFSKNQAIAALERATDSLKANFHIQASEEVPALICRLLERFLPYEVFPGRSIGLLR